MKPREQEQRAMTPDEVADALLEQLFENSAGLDAAQPARDLWAEIEVRITQRVVPIAEHVAAGRVRLAPSRWLPRAAAAAALITATAGLTYLATVRYEGPSGNPTGKVAAAEQAAPAGSESAGRPPSTSTDPAPPSSAASPNVAANVGAAGIADATASGAAATTRSGARLATVARTRESLVPGGADTLYDREIALLRAAVAERRRQLDPATVAVVERNLKVIDAAIAQARAALRRDPASTFLGEQLTRALASKVGLLRTAVLLPSSI